MLGNSKYSKKVNAWCMYDWANSVYSLVITTAIFPIFYNSVTTSASGSDIVNFFGLEIVNSLYVPPGPGDESISIGAV